MRRTSQIQCGWLLAVAAITLVSVYVSKESSYPTVVVAAPHSTDAMTTVVLTTTPVLTWEARAQMSTPRENLGAAGTIDGMVYTIGGYRGENYQYTLDTVERYDLATNVWTTRTSMPTSRYGLGVVAMPSGRIYAIGGSGGGTAVEEYDPASDTWMARAAMPTSRHGLGVALATNGKIYAVGGCCYSWDYPLATVEEYDPATDRWMSRASMSGPRRWLGVAAAANGKVYAIGGVASTGNPGAVVGTVEEYDPATNTWARRADMPTARYGLAVATASNGKIYAVGGKPLGGEGTLLATVEEYDPATDTWATRESLPTPHWNPAVVAASDGKLYVMGGRGNFGVTGAVEAATILFEPNDSFDGAATILPGFSIQDNIDSAADRDFFTFPVHIASTQLDISLTALPSDYDLYLYGPDRSLIASSTRPGTLTEHVYATAGSAGNYFVKIISAAGGFSAAQYTLRVSAVAPTPTATATATPTSTPTPTPTPTDQYEPNDTYSSAFPVSGEQVVGGRILPAGDVDFFKVYVGQAASTIVATLYDLPADFDLYLDRPDQTSAAASASLGTHSETVTHTVGTTIGHYYIVVAGAAGQFSAQPYSLRVAVQGPGTATATATATPTATATAPLPSPTPPASPTTPPAGPTGTPTPRSPVPVQLEAGWNNISLPFFPSEVFHASDLVASLRQQGVGVTHIARWQNGAWRSYIPDFGPEDWTVEYGRGYFVRVNAAGQWRP